MQRRTFAQDDGRKDTAESRAERAAEQEKAVRALTLRRTGMTYTQIADVLDVTPAVAGRLFRSALRAMAMEETEEQRALELERLDDLQRRAMAIVGQEHLVVNQGRVVHHPVTGDPLRDAKPILDALNTMIKISERRSRFLGLDMPVRHEVRHIDELDSQIEQFMAELVRRGQAAAAGTSEDEGASWTPPALEAGSSPKAAPPGRPETSSA